MSRACCIMALPPGSPPGRPPGKPPGRPPGRPPGMPSNFIEPAVGWFHHHGSRSLHNLLVASAACRDTSFACFSSFKADWWFTRSAGTRTMALVQMWQLLALEITMLVDPNSTKHSTISKHVTMLVYSKAPATRCLSTAVEMAPFSSVSATLLYLESHVF